MVIKGVRIQILRNRNLFERMNSKNYNFYYNWSLNKWIFEIFIAILLFERTVMPLRLMFKKKRKKIIKIKKKEWKRNIKLGLNGLNWRIRK